MDIGVRKEARHLGKEDLEEGIEFVLAGIQVGVHPAIALFDRKRAALCRELGVAREPARGMARHVELGDNADAAQGGKLD